MSMRSEESNALRKKNLSEIGDYRMYTLQNIVFPHVHEISDMKAYSIDGIDYVAISAANTSNVIIMRLQDQTVLKILCGLDYVLSLVLYKDPDDKQCLAIITPYGHQTLWNLHSYMWLNMTFGICSTMLTSRTESNSITSFIHFVTHNKRYFVYGLKNGDIEVRYTNFCIFEKTLKGHSGSVCALDVIETDEELYLVSAGADKRIFVWNLWNLRHLDLHRMWVTDPVCSWSFFGLVYDGVAHRYPICSLVSFVYKDRTCIASGDEKGVIKVWRGWKVNENTSGSISFSIMKVLEGHTSAVTHMKVVESKQSSMLVSSFNDGLIKFWNMDSMCLVHTLESIFTISYFEFVKCSNGKFLLILGSDLGHVSIWKNESEVEEVSIQN